MSESTFDALRRRWAAEARARGDEAAALAFEEDPLAELDGANWHQPGSEHVPSSEAAAASVAAPDDAEDEQEERWWWR